MRGFVRATSIALTLSVALAGSASAQAAPKFGYVNSAAILSQAPGRAEAEAQFNTEVKAYQAQLQRMSDSLQLLAANFDKEAPKLDSATREKQASSIRTKEADYQKRAQALDQQMQTRQAELVRPIMEQLQKIIEQVRSEDKYSMIFDVGSQTSVIVAADKSLDITEKVLARLKAAPKPVIKPASNTPTTTPTATLQQKPAGVSRPPDR
jgi:outer membrane protein